MYQSGCDAGRHVRRVVRAVQPDRVDLRKPAERGQHAEDEEEEAAGLDRVGREQPLARDGVARSGRGRGTGCASVGTTMARCTRDQRQEDGRDQQHVQRRRAAG